MLESDLCKIYGLGGDDNITTTSVGAITVDGGDGNDTLVVKGDRALVYGGNGNDNITIYAGYSSVNAGDGDDFVDVRNNNLLIYGGLGIILYLIMDKIPLLMGSEIRIMQKP